MVSKILNLPAMVMLVLVSLFQGQGANCQETPVFPRNWTLLFINFAHNDLEALAIKDMAKLTQNPFQTGLSAHLLVDTVNKGSYRVTINGDAQEDVKEVNLPTVDLSQPEILENFIRSAVQQNPAEKYGIIISGHGSAWLFRVDYSKKISISLIADVLKKVGIKAEFVGLDNCFMSYLESVYELKDQSRYVIAPQDYCPSEGLIGPKLLAAFEENLETEKILVKMAGDYLDRNAYPGADLCDISVLNLAELDPVVDLVRQANLKLADFKPDYLIDKYDPNYSDLLTLIKQERPNEFAAFKEKFDKVVIHYQQGGNKNNPRHNGLGIISNGRRDPYDSGRVFQFLKLNNLIDESQRP